MSRLSTKQRRARRRRHENARALTFARWRHDLSMLDVIQARISVAALFRTGDWVPHLNSDRLIRTPAALAKWWEEYA